MATPTAQVLMGTIKSKIYELERLDNMVVGRDNKPALHHLMTQLAKCMAEESVQLLELLRSRGENDG